MQCEVLGIIRLIHDAVNKEGCLVGDKSVHSIVCL